MTNKELAAKCLIEAAGLLKNNGGAQTLTESTTEPEAKEITELRDALKNKDDIKTLTEKVRNFGNFISKSKEIELPLVISFICVLLGFTGLYMSMWYVVASPVRLIKGIMKSNVHKKDIIKLVSAIGFLVSIHLVKVGRNYTFYKFNKGDIDNRLKLLKKSISKLMNELSKIEDKDSTEYKTIENLLDRMDTYYLKLYTLSEKAKAKEIISAKQKELKDAKKSKDKEKVESSINALKEAKHKKKTAGSVNDAYKELVKENNTKK